jgi:hypothetical protein
LVDGDFLGAVHRTHGHQIGARAHFICASAPVHGRIGGASQPIGSIATGHSVR